MRTRTLFGIIFVALAGCAAWALFHGKAGALGVASAPAQSAIEQYIGTLTLEQKVEGLLILHAAGTDPAALAAYAARYHPAGLILMGDNIPATLPQLRAEVAALQASTTYPYLVATDEEGCTVKRLGADDYACAPELGTEPAASSTSAFAARSALLKSVGINLNFGIVADVTSDPRSFIYPRSFGGDPQAVAARVAAAVEGSRGLTLSTLKHFPGHGETEADSHQVVPSVSTTLAQWQARDAVPFRAGVAAGADAVMFGQLTYAAVDDEPATLSAKWHTILAGMGFTGLAVTDDMLMLENSGDPRYSDPVENAVRALNAGNDLLLYVNNHGAGSELDVEALVSGIVAAVQSGQLPEHTVDAALAKVLAYRQRAGAL